MPQHFDKPGDLVKFCSNILFVTWEKHLTLIHLVITLAGATTLVFFNAICVDKLDTYKGVWWLIAAIVLSSCAMIFALIWRACCQHFMEHECFGNAEDLDEYFRICGVENVTATHVREVWYRPFYRFMYRLMQVITMPILLAAWACLLMFILRNT